MQNYKYVAIDLNKKKYTGMFMAEDEKRLAAELARRNLFLVSCSVYTGKTPNAFFTLGTGKVSISELTAFCRHFSIMIKAGIPITECFVSLKAHGFSSYFKSLLDIIYEDVRGGMLMSKALNKHKNVFPEFFRSMVYVGETSGNLDRVMTALADYYERDVSMKRKVKSALSYPIMIACLTVGVVVLMLLMIIPTFKDTLKNLSVTPEGFTKFVYDASDFLVANWLKVFAVIIVIALIVYIVSKTPKGSMFFAKLAIVAPLVGKVKVSLICSSFARSFSLLLSSGMDMVDALESVTVVITNKEMKRRFKLAVEEVKHGMTLVMAFEKHKLFPPVMIQMVSVGEKTATLDTVLMTSCGYFDEQAEATLMSVVSKIQPVLLLIMGGVIGSLFLAVYSPIISIMTSVM